MSGSLEIGPPEDLPKGQTDKPYTEKVGFWTAFDEGGLLEYTVDLGVEVEKKVRRFGRNLIERARRDN